MNELHELIGKVEAWGEARNLIAGSTPAKQVLKTVSELGELAVSMLAHKSVVDDIGDIAVTLIIINKQAGGACLAGAPMQKMGAMINGMDELLGLVGHIGTLADSIAKGHSSELVASKVWHAYGSLLAFADVCQLDMVECLEHAYNEIKDRKGRMVDGVFVKECD